MSSNIIKFVNLESNSADLDPLSLYPAYYIGGFPSGDVSNNEKARRVFIQTFNRSSSLDLLRLDTNDLYHTLSEQEEIPATGLPVKLQKIHFRAMDGQNGSISEHFSYFLASDPVKIVKNDAPDIVGAQYCTEDGSPVDNFICTSKECEIDPAFVSVKNWGSGDSRLIIGDSFRSFSSSLLPLEIKCDEPQEFDKIKIPTLYQESSNAKDCSKYSVGYTTLSDISNSAVASLKYAGKFMSNLRFEQGDLTWNEIYVNEKCEVETSEDIKITIQCIGSGSQPAAQSFNYLNKGTDDQWSSFLNNV